MSYFYKRTRDYLHLLHRIELLTRNSDTAKSVLVVMLVATIGGSLALQGWKSRTPALDLLLATEGAQEFVLHQQFPDRGAVASYAAFNPPGGAWLMVPGVFLFTDPRLYEFVGSLSVYIGTLFGIFLLARIYFGMRCATLAVVLYGLSGVGLFVAGSVWDRLALQFFYVWMVYWTVQWVTERNPKYLVAAILTLATGLYVFLEMAPAIFILPIIWIVYRPPVKLQPLFFGGLLILVLWIPYIRLEFTRNFADLRSLVLREQILPVNYKNSWCDPRSNFAQLGNIQHTKYPGSTSKWSGDNFDYAVESSAPCWGASKFCHHCVKFQFPGLCPCPSGWHRTYDCGSHMPLSTHLVRSLVATTGRIADRFGFWLPRFATGMIVLGMVANELIIAKYLSIDGILESTTVSGIRWLQLFLVLSGLALLMLRKPAARIGKQVVIRMTASNQTAQHSANLKLLVPVLSLVIPWVILLLMVENLQHLVRFWWLWPIQVVVLAAFVTHIPSTLQMPRVVTWIGSFLLILMTLSNPLIHSRVEEWLKDGWSGTDSDKILVAEYLASLFEREKTGHDRISNAHLSLHRYFQRC